MTFLRAFTAQRSLFALRPILHRSAPSYRHIQTVAMAPKRKRSAVAAAPARSTSEIPLPPVDATMAPPAAPAPPQPVRRASSRSAAKVVTNPELNSQILDDPVASRASPDAETNPKIAPAIAVKKETRSESPLSDAPSEVEAPAAKKKRTKAAPVKAAAPTPATPAKKAAPKAAVKKNEDGVQDGSEAEGDVEADEEEIKEASMRPPAVNSDYLPLPWKGRLGYACLNTYLRQAHPPVFASRTCRIASILEHRHPLKDPSQPEHATKNRPDKEQPASIARGQRYVEEIGLANARDLIKMLRWNDKYNIKFMRLSSEMFPFASHEEYGYKLAPFASETLAEVGKVVAELGHRVTTHPGQFTQLGSPRKQVVENAIRDLTFHDEMLSLLKLPEQSNRDAVMILHMGGIFEGKAETIARFKENYPRLSDSVKRRLVLENDDMGWSVHDLLPVCQELNIPMVLDYHHHNIVFDKTKIREGTKDIMDIYPLIKETWTRKQIKQKMHYSESCPGAITPHQRRKHSPRVMQLPPCEPDMDLMIEAKDKEQAVFELMKTYRLPGHEKIGDIIPYVRLDDNHVLDKGRPKKKATPKKKPKAKKVKNEGEEDDELLEAAADQIEEEEEKEPVRIEDEDVAMGGPDGRVYWPPTMEEWLHPKKREIKKKPEPKPATAKKAAAVKKEEPADAEDEEMATATDGSLLDVPTPASSTKKTASKKAAPKKAAKVKKEAVAAVPTPSTSADEDEDEEMPDLDDDASEGEAVKSKTASKGKRASGGRTSGRAAAAAKVSYVEDELSE